MQKAFALCVLAALCAVQTAEGQNINILIMEMQSLQHEATSIADTLRRFSNHLSFDVKAKLQSARINNIANVKNIVEPALKDVTDARDAAKAEGRDPTECYTNSKKELDKALIDGYNLLTKCVDENVPLVNPAVSNIDATVSVARSVSNQIGSMISACSGGGPFQQANCLSRALPQASSVVRNLRSTSNTVQNAGTAALNNAVSKGNLCFPQKISPLRPRVLTLRTEGLACIRNAK